MKNNKRKNGLLLIIALLLAITVGYAAIATTLKINGTGDIKRSTWNVHWENVQVNEESVTQTKPTLSEDNTLATFNVTLTEPGDFYEFTIDAKNDGSLDAMIETIESKINNEVLTSENLPDYLEYTIKYDDGTDINVNDELLSGESQKYRVTLKYRQDIDPSVLEDSDYTFNFLFSIKYSQKRGPQTPQIALCRKAQTLHKEKCNLSSASGNYCNRTHQLGEEIQYGKLSSGNNLTTGDALDCDVDGNNRYDSDERFYYLYESNNKAVLIYYNNVEKGKASNTYETAYDLDGNPVENGPKTAILDLPTKRNWRRVNFTNNIRNIYNDNGTIKKVGFSYEGYVARLLTISDLDTACHNGLTGKVSGPIGALDSCEFLYENTQYSNGNNNIKNGYWLENIFQYNDNLTCMITSYSGNIGYPTSSSNTGIGIRPVIEVNTSDIGN